MELTMDYEKTKELGIKKLLEFLNALVPHFEIYSISISWLESKEYIAKARGNHGDVIINWYKCE